MCGILAHKHTNFIYLFVYWLCTCLFIYRGLYLFHGRFSFVNLEHGDIQDGMDADLSLCRRAAAWTTKSVGYGPVLRKHLHALPWELRSQQQQDQILSMNSYRSVFYVVHVYIPLSNCFAPSQSQPATAVCLVFVYLTCFLAYTCDQRILIFT